MRADLESPDDVRMLAESAADVDILVNNAGVFAPRMVERGGGTIINVTTMVAE